MKVVIVNEDFGLGGIQRVSKVIGEQLSNEHEIYFYSVFNSENYYNIERNFYEGSFSPYFDFVVRGCNKIFKTTESFIRRGKVGQNKYLKLHLIKLLKFMKDKDIEVVILNGPLLISSIKYLKKKSDIKYVAWIHNNYDIYLNKYTIGYKSEFLDGLASADKAVCLTQSDLVNYSKINENMQCIYNPLTIDNTFKSTLKVNNISFTGRLSFEHKGIDYLLSVASMLPDKWTISIAGGGTDSEVEKLKKLIQEEGLEKKVIFLGSLRGNELQEHYLNSSIYLMTSRWEGMPLVLAEAMSFGLPIIAFEQSGSNEVLENGKYGILVKNGNINELSDKINSLIDSIEEREKYQKLSNQRLADFDIQKISDTWLNLLEDLKEDIDEESYYR